MEAEDRTRDVCLQCVCVCMNEDRRMCVCVCMNEEGCVFVFV